MEEDRKGVASCAESFRSRQSSARRLSRASSSSCSADMPGRSSTFRNLGRREKMSGAKTIIRSCTLVKNPSAAKAPRVEQCCCCRCVGAKKLHELLQRGGFRDSQSSARAASPSLSQNNPGPWPWHHGSNLGRLCFKGISPQSPFSAEHLVHRKQSRISQLGYFGNPRFGAILVGTYLDPVKDLSSSHHGASLLNTLIFLL